jgi:hypothetical protein
MSEMIRTEISLPRELLDQLEKISQAGGASVEHQIWEAVAEYIAQIERVINTEVPVLRADDPLLQIGGAAASGVGDLSTHHDQYLYIRERASDDV